MLRLPEIILERSRDVTVLYVWWAPKLANIIETVYYGRRDTLSNPTAGFTMSSLHAVI
jgi:hypothetical protein